VQVGFVAHPTIPMTGASPDGLVGEAGQVEIKCPNTATHLDTLLCRSVPGKYVTQMQWQMACTGREWCDFVSYDPRLPESMRVFVHRVPRDPELIASLEKDVADFLSELDAKLAQLVATYERREAA
jgi:predicted phage-related endonuclease